MEAQERVQLSKSIAQKVRLISQLREQLEIKRKTSGNSVDDELGVAELEYRLVKEEMALLTLQEKHWESAQLKNTDVQSDRSPLDPCGSLRSVRPHHCREAARLRLELTSVVGKLNRAVEERATAAQLTDRLQKECDELRAQNRQLKLQVLSLLCLHKSILPQVSS
ncbi:uncharacterized protein CDAR_62731 [Caerostris darwini]|uniref:Uncharacterized protein n=1 Tax=Caerostris darwini TaxID=1538125 RepID=A0AAV4UFA6_9ARAC|nr:uncharacterized protein CDAR_62731 [Caerostris darwini]